MLTEVIFFLLIINALNGNRALPDSNSLIYFTYE